MGSHKHGGCSSPEAIPTPVVNYHVTGTLTPDATCNYVYAGVYGGKSYYRRADGSFFIWWHPVSEIWYISPTPGDVLSPCWYRESSIMIGEYQLYLTTGIATVAVGSH